MNTAIAAKLDLVGAYLTFRDLIDAAGAGYVELTCTSEDGEALTVYGVGFGPDTGGLVTILPDGSVFGPDDVPAVGRVRGDDLALLADFDERVDGLLVRALRWSADRADDVATAAVNRRLADRLDQARPQPVALAG